MRVRCDQQEIQRQALDIANLYHGDTKNRWRMEAIQLRLPYWDWASDAVPPKEVILDKTVEIITPETEIAGHKTTTCPVPNPFLGFTFPKSIDLSILGPNFTKWRTTLRHPFPVDSPQAKSDVKDLVRLVALLYAISTILMIIMNFYFAYGKQFSTLQAGRKDLKDKVFHMFQLDDWHHFSHHLREGRKKGDLDNKDEDDKGHNHSANSLETIHDTIHM